MLALKRILFVKHPNGKNEKKNFSQEQTKLKRIFIEILLADQIILHDRIYVIDIIALSRTTIIWNKTLIRPSNQL